VLFPYITGIVVTWENIFRMTFSVIKQKIAITEQLKLLNDVMHQCYGIDDDCMYVQSDAR